jgi:excisionase family DNA binding protein
MVVDLLRECRDDIRLLSPPDLARTLGFSVRTINRMARKGQIPGAVFIGPHVRFRPDLVAAFLANGGLRSAASREHKRG